MYKLLLTLIVIVTAGYTAVSQIPAGYYNGTSGLQGDDLKTKLFTIIKGHTKRSYDNLWTDFQTTDKKSNGKVWDMYSDIPGGTPSYEFSYTGDQCGTYSAEGGCYNREHSFPKSWWGGGTSSTDTMYTDLFHLVPTDGYVNNKRANYCFGEVGTASWTSTNGSKLGTSNYPGYTGTVFEPIDDYKGDFARNYFYMATRYQNKFDSWAGNTDMLDGSGFSSWALDMLIEWHTDDPVSQKELDRNDDIYGIQGNRNPFIDHPEWVDDIWNPTASSDPAFASGFPKTDNIANTSFDILVKQDKIGTAYYVVLSDGASAPSSTQVKAGEDASGASLAANLKGSINIAAANTSYSSTVSSLTASTDYDVYVVSEDNSTPTNLQSSATLVDVSTSGGSGGGSSSIAEQNFESGSWNYTSTAGSGTIAMTTSKHHEGTKSLEITGSNKQNSDPYVVFDNIDISSYSSVSLEVAFAASGPDSGDDLYLDISFDNGSTWNGSGSVKLVDGYGNCSVAFGATNSSNPTTVSSNPWTVNIADAETQIKVRMRFDEKSSGNNTGDHYYIDAIKLLGTVASSNDNESEIILNTSWSEPTNIDYTSYTTSSGLTTANAIEVAKFTIRDGGSDNTDTDTEPTKLTDIEFTIDKYENIEAIAIFDGSSKVAEVTSVSSNTISFSSLTLEAADESTKDFSVYVGFKTTVTDNENLKFTISSATADASGSVFAASDAGAATTDNTGNNNKIIVTADRLDFSSSKPPSSVNTDDDFDVEVKATDANGNIDIDATNSIVLSLSTGSGTLSSASGLTQSLVSGVKAWSDVQYDTEEDFSIEAQTASLTNKTSITITASASSNYYYSDLIISEYVEGSSNNKYLEIWNNTGVSKDLSNYKVDIYSNGSSSAGTHISLSGTLNDQDVYVIAHSSATIWSGTPDLSTGSLSFNGNDAVALVNNNAKGNIDVFGNIGSSSNFAKDKTLVRNSTTTGPQSSYNSSEWDTKSKDNVSGLGNPELLPIELIRFIAERSNENIELKWQTATETNNDYFTVERSYNSKDFEIIGEVTAAGNSNEIKYYKLLDNTADLSQTIYYRLKQTDYDGKNSYSSIIVVNSIIRNIDLIKSYTQNEELSLLINSNKNSTLYLKVFNTNGQQLRSSTLEIQKGISEYKIGLKNLPSGVYILHLLNNDISIVNKFFY